MKLTDTQRSITEATGQNILVAAGAGTGKTRVLVERFLHLVTHSQALVTEILALTFTEKAANEMKSRILARLKELGMDSAKRDLELAYISTIHAFASRLLKEHPVEAGVDPDFKVVEAEESDLLREQALDLVIEKGCGAGDGTFELLRCYGEGTIRSGILRIFDAARTEGQSVSDFLKRSRGTAAQSLSARDLIRTVSGILIQLDEPEITQAWARFSRMESWNWESADQFRGWIGSFSRRGGKEDKSLWQELVRQLRFFSALK